MTSGQRKYLCRWQRGIGGSLVAMLPSDRSIAPYRRSATLQEYAIILVAKKQEIGQVRPVNGKYIRHKPQNRA
jgi:hypothetical protein